jgi:hypothetical protein
MDGLEGEIKDPTYSHWENFKTAIRERFLSTQEAREARLQMDKETYKNDIADYIMRMQELNNQVKMTGVAFRTCLE